MKIAILSTNIYPTPPSQEKMIYAPLWITHYLAEGLVKRGHDVFLFGSADSKTKATLISNGMPSLRKNKEWLEAQKKLVAKEKKVMQGYHEFSWATKWKEILRESYELLLASKLYSMAQKEMFDIIQFHSPPRVLHFAPLIKTPIIATIHDPLTHPFESGTVKTIYNSLSKAHPNIHLVSVSNAQRKPLMKANYAATIYHGVDIKKFAHSEKGGDYFVCAGRIVPWKGFHIAVRIAKQLGKKLKIAGMIPTEDQTYWKSEIKPYLSKNITYEGMLNQAEMVKLYQHAKALLFPMLWHESFGLVMTEAMACGTPVVAFNKGAVPEVVKHDKTGFVVNNQTEMIRAIKKIDQIKREDCRKWVEDNFSLEAMIDNYEKVYEKIISKK